MLSISVKSVLDRTRFFLNDVNATNFTDDKLIPAFGVAYDDLKEELYDSDIPVVTEVSDAFTITAGIKDIGGPTGPALPINLVVPLTLWERLSGTSDDYYQMGQFRVLPKVEVLTEWLMYWSYRKQFIQFLGATTDRQVKVDYIGDTLGFGGNADAQLNLFQAKSFLAYRTGGIAAEYMGENDARASKLNSNAQIALDKLLNTQTKNQQSMPFRRRPFMGNYKRNNWPYI